MRCAPEVQGFGGQQFLPYAYNPAANFGGDGFWNPNGLVFIPLAAPPVNIPEVPSNTIGGAEAGQQLLSMLQADDKTSAEIQDDKQGGRQLKPWEDDHASEEHAMDERVIVEDPAAKASQMQLDVPLEDMTDVWGAWDQFEVNRTRFGVKSNFKDDLSQYTTVLNITNIPAEVKREAERIAGEIEEEHHATGCLDGDGKLQETACDQDDDDEEAKFSAVTRCRPDATPEAIQCR
jgi:PAB1-binding protein PBP1